MDAILIGTVFTLVFGGFGYTYLVERNIQERIKDMPDKDDIQDLRERVNTLYEHLLDRPMPEIRKKVVK
jgi:hypothetical protein